MDVSSATGCKVDGLTGRPKDSVSQTSRNNFLLQNTNHDRFHFNIIVTLLSSIAYDRALKSGQRRSVVVCRVRSKWALLAASLPEIFHATICLIKSSRIFLTTKDPMIEKLGSAHGT